MSSRTSFVLTSGVLLFFTMCSTSTAKFNMYEFTTNVSTCFSDFPDNDISLPLDEVEKNVYHFDFEKNIDLATSQGVDDETAKYRLYKCFQDYEISNHFSDKQTMSILLTFCACHGLREDMLLPHLDCHAVADAVGHFNDREIEVKKILTEGGFDIDIHWFETLEHLTKCAPKIVTLHKLIH